MLCKEHEMLRDYKLGLHQVAVNLKVCRELGKEGFQSTQRARLYLSLWHPWLPREIFIHIMAHLAEGLSLWELGERRSAYQNENASSAKQGSLKTQSICT
jgi:hypothetical protein